MSGYRLYVFLMGGCKVSTRAKSYEQALGRVRQWSNDIEFVESREDPLADAECHKSNIVFESNNAPRSPQGVSYADAINNAIGG